VKTSASVEKTEVLGHCWSVGGRSRSKHCTALLAWRGWRGASVLPCFKSPAQLMLLLLMQASDVLVLLQWPLLRWLRGALGKEIGAIDQPPSPTPEPRGGRTGGRADRRTAGRRPRGGRVGLGWGWGWLCERRRNSNSTTTTTTTSTDALGHAHP